MVYPGLPVESTSRSSLDTPGLYQTPCSTPSIILPQQQLVYTSYNAYCGLPQVQSTFDNRRHPVPNNQPISLRTQDYRGVKSTKWHQKSRPRFKEYQQTQLPFTPAAPVILYDPLQTHLAAPIPSMNPVYLSQTATCYSQPLSTDAYTSYNPPVLPQTYYKPAESQFCIIHDRATPQLPHQPVQQSPTHSVSTTNIKSRNYGSSLGYSTSLGNIPHQSSSNFMNYSLEKLPISSSSTKTHAEVLYADEKSSLFEIMQEINKNPSKVLSEAPKKSAKPDKFFDDSSAFDFTIEPEKMVSSICNTVSSHDLDKDDDQTPRDYPAKPEKPWYLDYSQAPKTFRSTETQTNPSDDLQFPEILRKSIYNGCHEMEMILKNSTPTYRKNWLLSLSSATRMALTKSTTCFPIYLNDKAFAQDLMNSFLRISNGWLALDNYLNKQPNLSLSQKFNKDLQKSFKTWESSTANLLDNITRSFKKLDATSDEPINENPSNTSSFPGDVSLYVNYNLFSNCQPVQTSQVIKTNRNVSYPLIQNNEHKQRWLSVARESKVRTKWTITENQNLKDFPNLPIQQFQNLIVPSENTASSNDGAAMNIWNTSQNLMFTDKSPTTISQMDSNNHKKNDDTDGETINLSAWFASMRRDDALPNFLTKSPKNPYDIMGTSKMDANRQLRTLKNMRMIQSAPWTANQILEDQSVKKSVEDEAEDKRIYMKPGSYNVPKKKTQKRSARRADSSASRTTCPQAGQVPKPPAAFLSGVKSSDDPEKREMDGSSPSSTSSQDVQRDSTWKAACASAELLLDALNVEKKKSWNDKGDREDFSNSEASEDEFPKERGKMQDSKKTNVKTDSWLIRTLSDAKNNDSCKFKRDPSEDAASAEMNADGENSYSLETSHTIAVMTLVDVVGKATYSETVRRFSSTAKPSSLSKTAQKSGDNERVREQISSNRVIEDVEKIEDKEIKIDCEKIGKTRKGKGQASDKGWSVWYSSRRKQQNSSLGPIAMEKLMGIYRVLWRMDGTRIFKFPGATTKDSSNAAADATIENYRKVIKSPMFLETIGYKLKNHVYRKVEHVLKDFRKIVHNSKIYHKNDKDCTEKIEILSRKFEELVDQQFSDDAVVKLNLHDPSNSSVAIGSPINDEKEATYRRNIRNSSINQ